MYSSTLSLTSAFDVGGWSTPRSGHFTHGRVSVPIVQEAGWVHGRCGRVRKNLACAGIRSPDRPAGSELLYRLNYPSQPLWYQMTGNFLVHSVSTLGRCSLMVALV